MYAGWICHLASASSSRIQTEFRQFRKKGTANTATVSLKFYNTYHSVETPSPCQLRNHCHKIRIRKRPHLMLKFKYLKYKYLKCSNKMKQFKMKHFNFQNHLGNDIYELWQPFFAFCSFLHLNKKYQCIFYFLF